MTEATSSTTPEQYPAILELADVMRRYRIGKTKALELVTGVGFPDSVVPGMHRYPLAAVELWEIGTSLEGTIADPYREVALVTPPARGQVGRPRRSTAHGHRPVAPAQKGAL